MLRLVAYLVSTQGLSSFLGLVYWAMAARLLTLGEVGRAAATLALISFVASTSNFGLGVALTRYRHRSDWDYPRLAGSALAAATLMALVLSGLVSALYPAGGDRGLVLASWAFVPATIIALICNMLDSLSVADADGAGVLLRSGTAALGKLVLLVLLVHDDAAMVVTTMTSVLVSALIVWPRRRRSVRLSISMPRLPPTLIGYALQQYVVTWLYNLPNYLFPVLALALLGPDVAGYVALAWGGAALLSSVGDAAGTALLTAGSRDRGSLGAQHRRAFLRVGAGLAAAVAVAVAAAPVLSLVFGPRFDANAIALFRLIVVASLPYLLVATTLGRLRALDRSFASALLGSLSGLGACVGLIILAPLAGPLAPGWAYLFANVGAALVSVRMLKSMRTPHGGSISVAPEDGADRIRTHTD